MFVDMKRKPKNKNKYKIQPTPTQSQVILLKAWLLNLSEYQQISCCLVLTGLFSTSMESKPFSEIVCPSRTGPES